MEYNKHKQHPNHDHHPDHDHPHELDDDSQNSADRAQIALKKVLIKNKHNAFKLPFFLILIFAFVELIGGVWSQSLALLSDAWHMFSDVLA